MSSPPSKLVAVKLPRSVANRLSALAKRTGRRQSQLIREGLDLRLAVEGKAGIGSVLDLAGDAVGSLRGPPDLGSNPRHLRGFGK